MFKSVIMYLNDLIINRSKQIIRSLKNVNTNDISEHVDLNILVNHVFGIFLTGKQRITENEAFLLELHF